MKERFYLLLLNNNQENIEYTFLVLQLTQCIILYITLSCALFPAKNKDYYVKESQRKQKRRFAIDITTVTITYNVVVLHVYVYQPYL